MKESRESQSTFGTLIPAVPQTKYFLSTEEFDTAVGTDFIKYANRTLEKGEPFMVGALSWAVSRWRLQVYL
jgi:hypothetical protein